MEILTSDSKPDGAEGEFKKIVIGICAMQRKANSKPMRSIMGKMCEFYMHYLDFLVFPEETILNEPVDRWPRCDCLISFHSTDFPLKKAIEYEKLRRPYVLNDLHRQFDLLDRRKVFRTLARAGVDHPRHCVLIRNDKGELIGDELHEHEDYIEVNGMVFNKPFVEKPVNAEDHNIYIYYPTSVGGGSQRLFRKVNDRSSWYSPVSTVRKEGSYLYEEFIPADGTDVKVYAVGPYYAHAEARKAPGLDGKVERDADGKEVRYPVILSAKEKTIARRVVLAFGSVCGFDLLRANGSSYVCDVNGFSFVKTSTKYYEDTAKILGNTILRRLATSLSIPWHIPFQDDDPPLVSTPSGKIMELRCVLAVIRHGDRTPKQKMKVAVRDARVWKMFQKYDGLRKRELKLKKPTQLMEVLEIVRQLLQENLEHRQALLDQQIEATEKALTSSIDHELDQCEEAIKTWEQMRTVLEMYGHFSGINRKVQLKYIKSKADDEGSGGSKESLANMDAKSNSKPSLLLQDGAGSSTVPTLHLILKWGGELTTAGVLQAEALGKLFRTLYPGIRRTDGKDSPEDTQGLGFLRLHSTYRHDLKIYSSDEGRVQMTAAAFAKGLLALEGELTPILMQMVKSANTDGLLNDDYNARRFQDDIKAFLYSVMQADRDFTPADYQALNPFGLRSLNNAMEFIKNPRKMCHEVAGYVQRMCEIIRWHKMNNTDRTLYLNESWELAERRWTKELREFRRPSKNGGNGDGGNPTYDFDISKIPDIYDNIKYDMEHNPDLCVNNEGEFERFYMCVKNIADIVVPLEYGVSEESKICIAQRVCTPLMAKIRNDLHRCVQSSASEEAGGEDESLTRLDPRASEGIATPMRHVRTRLYFTSESHIHTLMNLIRYGGLCSPDDKKWQRAMNFLSGVTEFNYMTQLVMMVYEDSRTEDSADKNGGKDGKEKPLKKDPKDRFHIELLFSPGLYPCFQTEKERIYESRYSHRHSGKASKKHSSNNTAATLGKQHSSSAGVDTAASSDKETTDAGSMRNDGTTITAVNPAMSSSMLSATLAAADADSGAQSDYSQNSDCGGSTRKTSTAQPAAPQSPKHAHHLSGGSGGGAGGSEQPQQNSAGTDQTNQQKGEGGKQQKRESRDSVGSAGGDEQEEVEDDDEEDEDDLTEENAVNLVVLDEVSAVGGGKPPPYHRKSDLKTRHTPSPPVSANGVPARKRHATYERDIPEKAEVPEAATDDRKREESGSGIGGGPVVHEYVRRIVYHRQTSNNLQQQQQQEVVAVQGADPAVTKQQQRPNSSSSAASSAAASSPRDSTSAPGGGGGPPQQQHQRRKSIIKSMSDVFGDEKQLARQQQQQSVEQQQQQQQLDADEAAAIELEQCMEEQLRVEEGQETVGHGRGEWAKQLLEETKEKKEKDKETKQAKKGKSKDPEEDERQMTSSKPQAKRDAPQSTSSSSIQRVPLSSVFCIDDDDNDEKEEKKDEDHDRGKKEECCETSKKSGGTTEKHHYKKHQKKTTKDAEKTTMTMDRPPSSKLLESVQEQQAKLSGSSATQSPSSSTIKDEDMEEHIRALRRPRFPYRFKHHTVNLLTQTTKNRLISTDVLMGKFNNDAKGMKKASNTSVVLATAVIGRSSSAPRLQTYSAGDELIVNEIRRFWPPLRSLETMHDNLSWAEVDEFLKRMMMRTGGTPLPSPPRTPVSGAGGSSGLTLGKKKMDTTVCRLSPLEH